MALIAFAWVAQEDVEESDTTFSRCEMLQESEAKVLNRPTATVIRIDTFTQRYKNKKSALVRASIPYRIMPLLAGYVLRC